MMDARSGDGLDDIISSLQANQPNKLSPKSTGMSNDTSKPNQTTSMDIQEPYNAAIEATVDELRLLLINLADQSYLEEVNQILSQISYNAFTSYYITNTALGKYSMNAELQRLNIELRYPAPSSSASGVTITTDKLQILSFYESCQLNDIWRFCNQSIFADIYSAISDTYLPPGLQSHISLLASKVHIIIDYDSQIKAISTLDYYIHTSTSKKLQIASIDVQIILNFKLKSLRMSIEPPHVNMIFDNDLRLAARAIHSDAAIPTIADEIPSISIAELAEKSRSVTNKLMEGAVASLGRLLRADTSATTLYQRPVNISNNDSTSISNGAAAKKSRDDEEEWDEW